MYAATYHRPRTLADAVSALSGADEGKVLAGGQTLIPTMKQHLAAPSDLVDIRHVDGMRGITAGNGAVTIAAATTHAEVAGNADVQRHIPALASLAAGIGDPAVRHMGTIGGSVANNDPAADYPAAVLGLGATIVTDRREIAADDWFQGMFAAFAVGRDVIERAVALGKVRGRGEAAGQRHVDDAHVGLHQQVARLLQPHVHVVLLGAFAVQIAAEQAFQLPRGQPTSAAMTEGDTGSSIAPSIIWITWASLGWRTPIRVGTDRRWVSGRCGSRHRSAGRPRHSPRPRHGRRRSASASGRSTRCRPLSSSGAVDHEDRLGQPHIREVLGKAVLVLPVDRGAAPDPAARPRPAYARRCKARPPRHPAPRFAPQPVQHALGRRLGHVDARRRPGSCRRGRSRSGPCRPRTSGRWNRPPVARLPRPAPRHRQGVPHPVGDAQAVERPGKGQKRETRQQQKDEAPRLGGVGRGLNWHGRRGRGCRCPTIPTPRRCTAVEAQLSKYPPLVFAGEARKLKAALGRSREGEAFLLQGGDCAESFAEFTPTTSATPSR
jgi:CO/xanthine dehydrogenase FAD-binding subunit